MTENAFRKPVFHVGGTVPPKLLVDRTKELLECKAALLEKRGNVRMPEIRGSVATQTTISCLTTILYQGNMRSYEGIEARSPYMTWPARMVRGSMGIVSTNQSCMMVMC